MIRGMRIVLRAIERQDLPNYVEWFNDPVVLEYFGRYRPLSLAEEEQWYEQMLQDPKTCNFAIELEDRHVGGAGFNNIDGRNASAEVGLFIGLPELWDHQGGGCAPARRRARSSREQPAGSRRRHHLRGGGCRRPRRHRAR